MKSLLSTRMSLTCAALALSLAFGACSKKKRTEGDEAGDTAAMQATDLQGGALGGSGQGAKIPELGTVYFAYDSFALTAEAKKMLSQHAAWAKANSGRLIQLEGHTDERGTTEYNLALGERRAAAVRDYLVTQGVPASQLSTISYGEERPAASGSDEAAWAQNRRTEFVNN